MGTITTRDNVTIYYKDWGAGQPVVLSHGWPLSSDSWESQALFLAANGFRVITHDRRGHGRSSQPWQGNDMDNYADDLAELIEALDLKGVSLFGFSTGGGEIARGRPADRGFRRYPRGQPCRPVAALQGHRKRPVLRLQPARCQGITGPD